MSKVITSRVGYKKSKCRVSKELTVSEKLDKKKALSIAATLRQTGMPIPSNQKKIVRSDGAIFGSIMAAAKALGANEGSVTRVLRQTTHKTLKGFSFLRQDKHSSEFITTWLESFRVTQNISYEEQLL